jgi:hypothetical protein
LKLPNNVPKAQKQRKLEDALLTYSLFNFIIVASTGVLLRGIPTFDLSFLSYSNLLHGHSHFAFGGWITPILVWIVLRYFPEAAKVRYSHWRNIIVLMMGSAYGMVLSFPFQGYAPLSLVFSTMSIVATLYFSVVMWRALKGCVEAPQLFLRASLIFLVVSSLGPFATGPLIASGFKGTPLYYNAIHFYLHFQLNGFFQFVVLASMYRISGLSNSGKFALPSFFLISFGSTCTLALSFLWNKPGELYNILGAIGALTQLIGIVMVVADLWLDGTSERFSSLLRRIVCLALLIKSLLQCLSAVPTVAAFAFLHRDVTVAYLHLITLGVVTFFAMYAVYAANPHSRRLSLPLSLLVVTFVMTELLLAARVVQSVQGAIMPATTDWLFWFSMLFMVAAVMIFFVHVSYGKRRYLFFPISRTL